MLLLAPLMDLIEGPFVDVGVVAVQAWASTPLWSHISVGACLWLVGGFTMCVLHGQ
uniref:Uncharacterized protein n=1 Tax=Oryza sativa subsp. japonica TaxID=39947 RepID=Q67TP8_ORYSJ|nr:hypothetical protein [Oryza sativa Japonica Group]